MVRKLTHAIEGLGDKGDIITLSKFSFKDGRIWALVNETYWVLKSDIMEATSVIRLTKAEKQKKDPVFYKFFIDWHTSLKIRPHDETLCKKHWDSLTKEEKKIAIEKYPLFQKDRIEQYNDPKFVKSMWKYLKAKNFNEEFKTTPGKRYH